MCICYGLNKFHEYIFGKKVTVETDHQPLISIFKKPLNKCPARLQRMLIQIQKYDIEVKYKRGKDLLIADALSRAYLPNRSDDDRSLEIEIDAQICLITSQINATDTKMQEIREKTKSDEELIVLKNAIENGWPNDSKKLNEKVKIYCKYRDDLTIINGIIFKGQCILVPKNMRKEMLNKIHYSHLGANKCINLAQQTLFWPNMINEIKQFIANCHVCQTYAKSQRSEPLKPHEIGNVPWYKVGCDLFDLKGEKFLLIADYYSKFVELEKLTSDTTSNQIINKMKYIFARHGIPSIVVSDGGPQFSSEQFKNFAKEWDFNHVLSSPTYAQSNGMAERQIQTIKNMLRKTIADHKELPMALLHFRNTPIVNSWSPAQILMSRKLRSNLPCSSDQLKPKTINTKWYHNQIKLTQNYQQQIYDNKKGVKALFPLHNGTHVYVQLKPQGTWTPAIVLSRLRDRSYKLRLETGSIVSRNRKFIKPDANQSKTTNHRAPQNERLVMKSDCNRVKYYLELSEEEKEVVEPSVAIEQSVATEPSAAIEQSVGHKASTSEVESETFISTKTSSGRIVRPVKKLDL